MKIKYKKIKILILILFILLILSSRIFAVSGWFKQATDFIKKGEEKSGANVGYGSTINTDGIEQGSEEIYNILLAVGTIVVIAVGAILGIQFMTAGIDKKVDVKKSLVVYVISSTILFGAFGIWKLIVNIMKDIV